MGPHVDAVTFAHQSTSVPFEVLVIPRSEMVGICGIKWYKVYTAHSFAYLAVYGIHFRGFTFFDDFIYN